MRKHVIHTLIISAGILGLATTARAADGKVPGLKANVEATSNYVFRGQTLSDDDPAIQGGIDYNHPSGFYAGAWGSTAKFPFYGSTLEYDLYAGINFPINPSVKMDVGYIAYNYTDSTINDNVAGRSEVYIGAKYQGLSGYYFKANTKYNNDYQYIDLRYTMALPQAFKLTLHYGHLDPDRGSGNDDASVRIAKNFSGFDTGLTLSTVNHDYVNNGNSKSRLFITVTKYFDL